MLAFSRAWYNGSYTMAAKPIKTLELHYTMIYFFLAIEHVKGISTLPYDDYEVEWELWQKDDSPFSASPHAFAVKERITKRSWSPISVSIIHNSHLFTMPKIYYHIYSIVHVPHIDIPILAVCRMFVPST